MSKNIVIKPSQSIQMSNTVSVFQRKVWNVLLARAFDELKDTDNDTFEASIDDVFESLGLDITQKKMRVYFKEGVENLNSTAVKWNLLDKDKDKKWTNEQYGVIPLLAGTIVNLEARTITYSFSPLIRDELANPKMYAKIMLGMQSQFQSKHALSLYELGIDYLDEKRGEGETPFIDLVKFRELMGVSETEYTEYKRLATRVIKQPIKEVNDKSDISIEYEQRRVGRKVVALKFKFKKKKVYQDALALQAPLTVGELKPGSTSLEMRLEKIGLGSKQIKMIITQAQFDEVRGALDILDAKLLAGQKIHNPSGYFLKLIKMGAGRPNPVELEERLKEQLAKSARDKREQLNGLFNNYKMYKKNIEDMFLKGLDADSIKLQQQQFLIKNDKNELVLEMYRKNKFNDVMVGALLERFILDNNAESIKILTFEEWASEAGYIVEKDIREEAGYRLKES